MENNGFGIVTLDSHATKKYRIHYYQKHEYAGKNYHSFVVYSKIRNYYQQIESGVNYSDTILQEYMDELV
jgi:hypothetical protein